jgi:hypothetical protein
MMEKIYIQSFFVLSFLCSCLSAVTVVPATLHLPKAHEKLADPITSDFKLLVHSIPDLAPFSSEKPVALQGLFGVMSSINGSGVHPYRDSFVRGSIDAFVQHQHFVIRPDEVWFTILTQLNFYLRSHRDSKEVREKIEYQDYFDVSLASYMDIGAWAVTVVEFGIKHWVKGNYSTYSFIQPNFTTSLYDDIVTANLITMGYTNTTSESYSKSICGGGMPSVTLLGTKSDWQQLLLKLDRMPEFGSQPEEYSKMLRPILSRVVRTFVDPDDSGIRQFWDDMVSNSKRECSEPGVVTGWLSGFQYWNQAGDLISRGSEKDQKGVSLDGVVYPWRNIHAIPSAYSRLHFRNHHSQGCVTSVSELLAGTIGRKVNEGQPKDYAIALQRAGLVLPTTVKADQHGTLQPISRWFQYYDSRYQDPPKRPGEENRDYIQRVCKNRPEGDGPVYNFPQGGQRWRPTRGT